MNTYDVLRWAEEQTCGGPGPKAVLMALARMAGLKESGQWEAWPSQELLASITEQSIRTVSSQLKELERRGYIARSPRYRSDGGRSTDLVTLGLPANLAGGLPATRRGTPLQPVAEQKDHGSNHSSAPQTTEEPGRRGGHFSQGIGPVVEYDPTADAVEEPADPAAGLAAARESLGSRT